MDTGSSRRPTVRARTLVIIGIVGAALLAAGIAAATLLGEEGLTAGSPCSEFLDAPAEDRETAVARAGRELELSNADQPRALPAIENSCARRPDETLGQVMLGLGWLR